MVRERRTRLLGLTGMVLGLALVAAACGNGAGASGSGSTSASGGGSNGPSVRIASPADAASVSQPFTVKLDASVPLGDPSSGEDHVHLCFDGKNCDSQYKLAYGSAVAVSGLTPGTHTIEASLRNADHSDAGAPTASTTVTITKASSGNASPTPTQTSTSGSRSGYGY